MRFTSRDILAETSATIAREKISKTAEINEKQLPSMISSVVSTASVYTVLNFSVLHPKANLQFATVSRNLQGLCREVVSLVTFFPLFLKSILGFQASFICKRHGDWLMFNKVVSRQNACIVEKFQKTLRLVYQTFRSLRLSPSHPIISNTLFTRLSLGPVVFYL